MQPNHPQPRTIASKIFAAIARENADRAKKLHPALTDLEDRFERTPHDTEGLEKWGDTNALLVKSACVAIVFAAAAAEAFIYDYGARATSDSYMKNYLDKLDTIQKWVVVPQIAKGTAFPVERQGFELLRKLVKARNSLVHFKSGVDNTTFDAASLVTQACEAIQAIDSLVADMDEFDPNENPSLQLP